VVTRNDLTLQYQLPQCIHSVVEVAIQFPEEHRQWHKDSNTVVVLAAKDLNELEKLCEELEENNLKFVKFFEPDVGMKLTSISIVPDKDRMKEIKKICSKFKLAGK
jgi:peptidyl-tRNA hydrolase